MGRNSHGHCFGFIHSHSREENNHPQLCHRLVKFMCRHAIYKLIKQTPFISFLGFAVYFLDYAKELFLV